MRKLALLIVVGVLTQSSCVFVDWAVDPVGCQVGSHEPIFPWYPHYLWNPPQRKQPPVLAPATSSTTPAATSAAPCACHAH
jgi:hypothetical protein